MKCPIIKVDFTGNIGILTTNQLEKDKYNTENTKISASGGIQHLPEPKVLVYTEQEPIYTSSAFPC